MLKLVSIIIYVSVVVAMRPVNPVKKTNLQNYPKYEIPNWVYKDVFSQNINKYKVKKKESKENFKKRNKNNQDNLFIETNEVIWDDFLKYSKSP